MRLLTLPALLLMLMLAACSQEPQPPAWAGVPGADRDRGRLLMARYQCGSCHVASEVFAAGGRLGPSLDGFGRRSYIAGELPNTPELLQRWLIDPPGLLPGATMPALGVSAADARDMAGYLLSLR